MATLALWVSAAAVSPARAQDTGRPIGFSGSIGYGGAGGDFGPFLDAGWTSDFSFFVEYGRFRVGFGAELSGYATTPGGAYDKWSVNPFYGLVGWTFRRPGSVRPYLVARVGSLRMRPFVLPERTGDAVNGWSLSLVPGVEIPLRGSLRLRPADGEVGLPIGRRHDYGPGLGAFVGARLVARQAPILEAYYRFQWIHVVNDTAGIGGGADHRVQLLGGRLQLPLFAGLGLGLGVEGEVWTQTSRFSRSFLDVERRLTHVRAYATWQLGGF